MESMLADEPTGGGNPNFFKTFKGKYSLTPSSEGVLDTPTVMLSCTNDVQIIGDAHFADGYTAGTACAVLPEECRPAKEVGVPVSYHSGTSYGITTMVVMPTTGEVSFQDTFTEDVMFFVSGINFNISGNWY